jgi:hypothetical protein
MSINLIGLKNEKLSYINIKSIGIYAALYIF